MLFVVTRGLIIITFLLQQQFVSITSFAPKLPLFTPIATSTTSAAGRMIGGTFTTSVVSMAEDDDKMLEDETTAVRVEPDTHDELMYALGVNLARQLGDIRPLVESGEELAQVAKGLLDTVVGRLNEDGQREILQKRGKELNEIIASRAYVPNTWIVFHTCTVDRILTHAIFDPPLSWSLSSYILLLLVSGWCNFFVFVSSLRCDDSNVLRERLEKQGREMLANMSQTEGAQKLDNGVVLHVLEFGPEGQGKGVRPTKSSVVLIHYHGTLADGTIFDSTLGGDPVKFPLAQVIPGWRDGVLKMHEGETAMLGIPPEQAYGAEGTPDGRIPGGSTLFFKIQLVKVLSAGVGGEPSLLGADGKELGGGSSGLVGGDGKPLN